MDERYNPKESEPKWQKYWEEQGIYKFDPKSDKEIYSIDTPPPTVSGAMHLGHSFMYSQMDFIARFKRMTGHELFYPFGTDDNGLATERLIEKTKGVSSKKMEREEFIKLCLETLKDIRPKFIADWKQVGISCDFSIFYSTINDHCRRISQKSFLDLYKAGRIYQKKAPIIFCPGCKTAIAQVEMEDVEKTTTLNYLKGKLETGEYIIYATTRPELHPGCVGISLDERGIYAIVERDNGERWIISKDAVAKMREEFPMEVKRTMQGDELIGKEVEIALAQKPIKISHDESAKTDYGSGIVFYCTYGGLDCVEWMARHPEAEPIYIMDKSGTYIAPSPYVGLNSLQARKQSLEDLEKSGLLIKKEKMKHAVNTHERCANDIEYVATKQWFIKYLDLKEDFLAAGNKLNWYPPHMKVRYDNWIKGLKWDWCISRQRHYGVPLPVWYKKGTNEVILPEESELPIDPLKSKPLKYKNEELIPEKDVLDTWATSSMTPQLATQLFPEIQNKLFPMNLRPQAHDIITFWLFNTVVKSQLHYDTNPWQDVIISGHAQDPHGKKMSKSKGNIIAPQVMVEKYSADALRFWAAGSKLGEDLPFQEKDLVTGQKFSTKLWNASKFSISHLQDYQKSDVTETMDKWLVSKLQRLIKECSETFQKYEYSRTKADVEKFFWHTFCDQYLEISKDRLYNSDKRGDVPKKSAQEALHTTLLAVLKLISPIMPHITEEIYHLYYAKEQQSIHTSTWPTYEKQEIDEKAEKAGDIAIDIINTVRKFKSENKLSLKEELSSLTLESSITNFSEIINSLRDDLQSVLKIKTLNFSGPTNLETEKFGIKMQITH
jgi:valyl-tRNA synthetase